MEKRELKAQLNLALSKLNELLFYVYFNKIDVKVKEESRIVDNKVCQFFEIDENAAN